MAFAARTTVVTTLALPLLMAASPTYAAEGDFVRSLYFKRLDAGAPMDPVRAMLEIRRPLDARYLSNVPCEESGDSKPHNPIPYYNVTLQQLTVRCSNNVEHAIAYSRIFYAEIFKSRRHTNNQSYLSVQLSHSRVHLTLIFPNETEARTFVYACYWLGHLSQLTVGQTEPQFQASLVTAKASGNRTEAQRRAQVQAEALLKMDRPSEAALLYREALATSPDWSQGHYNLALVYGSLGFHSAAIIEMRRYLYLDPNASDARAAQDQIYGWEALVRTSGGV